MSAEKFILKNHPDPDSMFRGDGKDGYLLQNIIKLMEAYAIHERERMLNVNLDEIFPIKKGWQPMEEFCQSAINEELQKGAKALLNHLKQNR